MLRYDCRNVHYAGPLPVSHSAVLSSPFINYLFSFENLAKTETKIQFKEATENNEWQQSFQEKMTIPKEKLRLRITGMTNYFIAPEIQPFALI